MTKLEISNLWLKNRKNKGAGLITHPDALIFMLHRPAEAFRKSGGSRMYTFEPPILYSEAALRGVRSGQHPICFHILLAISRLVPLGFCSGGFSSTAGYVPGNEARRLST